MGWCKIWDALYYRFLHIHNDLLKDNPRMSLMYLAYNKKKEINEYTKIADEFLEKVIHR